MTEIKLKHPITVGVEKITVLKMRRPKVKDQLAADKFGTTDAEKEIRMFTNLCEVTPETFDEVDLVDYLRIQEVYAGFLSPKRKQSGSSA